MNRYERYKKVDLPWMKEVPEHWEVKRNKSIFKEKKEVVGERFIDYKLLSLTLRGVIERNLDGGGKFPASFEKYVVVKSNDFVFCLFDMDETPRTIGLSSREGMITGAYTIFEAYTNYSSQFLNYFYLYIDSIKGLKPYYSGLRKTVNLDKFNSIKIPIPPLDEQKKIAAYLDWKINEINRLIAVEKEKIVNIDKYVQNKISEQYKNFDKRRLKTVLKEPLLYGINSSGSEMGKIRFIRITDIDKGGNLKNKNELYIDECNNKYLLNKGDILLARSGATVGKAYLHIDDDNIMAFAGYLIRARVDQSIILPNYLYFYLLSNEYELWKENVFIQSTIQNISAEKYSNLRIPYVSKKKQIEIISNISKILREKNNIMKSINETIDQLNSLKNSLISEVVTGKIDVRNVVIPSYEKVGIDVLTDEEEIKE